MSAPLPSTVAVLTEAQFDELFPLLTNHLDGNASFNGCMFETYGAELSFAREQNPDCIWTLMTDDDGLLCLASGYHFVNRLGYLISTVSVQDGQDYFVPLEEPDEEADA